MPGKLACPIRGGKAWQAPSRTGSQPATSVNPTARALTRRHGLARRAGEKPALRSSSGKERRYRGRAFALHHLRQEPGHALHNAVQQDLSLFRRGQSRLWIRLIGARGFPDVLRKRGQGNGRFKFLRVAGKIAGKLMAALEAGGRVGFGENIPKERNWRLT